MKIAVNSEVCEGYGNCARIAPQVFELDAEGFAQPLNDGVVPAGQESDAEYAEQDCPMGAISIEKE